MFETNSKRNEKQMFLFSFYGMQKVTILYATSLTLSIQWSTLQKRIIKRRMKNEARMLHTNTFHRVITEKTTIINSKRSFSFGFEREIEKLWNHKETNTPTPPRIDYFEVHIRSSLDQFDMESSNYVTCHSCRILSFHVMEKRRSHKYTHSRKKSMYPVVIH